MQVPEQDDGRELLLIREAQAGDAAAFRALFDAYFHFVLRTCSALGLGPSDADDALQETFIVAHRKLRRFQGGSFAPWLYRIAANVVSARHRTARVRQALASIWLPREQPAAPEPDLAVHESEARRDVARVLARMRPKKREVFALFELEGLSGEEIAGHVGCSLGTVWTRLYHARRDFVRIGRKLGVMP
ncbi:MAG TPA: RNA polymerase sigma factor [Myxococcales bacterium]|nr:RNA polymerase sigma factor [Myxococcales bacterium]